MALSSLRLRRTLSGLSTLNRSLSALSFPRASSSPLLHGPTSSAAQSPASPPQCWTLLLQSWTFRSTSFSSSARTSSYGNNNQKDEIGPDTILFEGCDYKHWLFVMDFGRDNKPSPEEMVRTYEETCAKGLNISVEEAKQKMYACSTTTYTGFQAVMSEEESEKFNGLPGVIFVLPDSYIDPQNKEYGGDKYINGTIIPRPPPARYGRQEGRYNDPNRNQQRYDRQVPIPKQQGNPSYGQQGPMQGGGNYGASQNYPQNRGPVPVSTPGGRDAYQPGRDPVPSYQGSYNQEGQQNYNPQGQRSFPQGDRRNYAPPGPGGYRGDDGNYGPPHTETHGQGWGGFQGQGTAQACGQGPSSGADGQGLSSGSYGQGPSLGEFGQGPSSGAYGQAAASGNGQSYPGLGGDESFSQGEQWNLQGEQSSYAPMGQKGIGQGRY